MTTDPTELPPAGDRLFALIASIPGSGTFDWCSPARALLDEIAAMPAAPVAAPPTGQADAVDRAAVIRWCADKVRSTDSDYAVQQAAEYLDDLALEAQEERDEAQAQANLDALADLLPAPADRSAVLEEAATIAERLPTADRYRHHSQLGDAWDDGKRAVAAELRRLAAETPGPETQGEVSPVCEGFVWIGQSFATCDRCGQPAWDHEGEEVAVEGAGPFGTGRVVRPWKPGVADAIRAKWALPGTAPAVVAEPGKENDADRIVAYRSDSGRLIHCLQHVPPPAARHADFHPVISEDLPDGGICTHPGCGVDVLAQQPKEA